MSKSFELHISILREKINITRKMLEIGYFPYTINFNANGNVQIEGRESVDTDQKLLEDMVRELSSIDGGPPN
jgi:hypothetical protein